MKKIIENYKHSILPSYKRRYIPFIAITILILIAVLFTINVTLTKRTNYIGNAQQTENLIEPENSTFAGNIALIDDQSASGGKYIMFPFSTVTPLQSTPIPTSILPTTAPTPVNSTPPPNPTGEKAIMSDLAADMVGVNTHFNFLGYLYDTQYEMVKSKLLESGIRNIRDNPGTAPHVIQRYKDLAASGIKVLMINMDQTTLGYDYVKSINSQGTQVINAIEPPNERDGQWEMLCQFQKDMWNKYRTDSSMSNVQILGPSLANGHRGPEFASACPGISSYMNAGNVHDYSGSAPESPIGGGYGKSLDASLTATKAYVANKPIWATENGYTMFTNPYTSSSELGAAKYMPRQFLTHLMKGVPRLFVYEFIDWNGNENEYENFGIINANGTPRLQFNAIKSFISIFNDPGPSFEPGSLTYTLSGSQTNVHHLLLQKRNGNYYLAIWQGAYVTSPSAAGTTNIDNPDRSITLNLANPAQTVKMYKPSTNGTNNLKTLTNTKTIALSVPDHVLVIEISNN